MNRDDRTPDDRPLLDEHGLDALLDASPPLSPSAQLMRRVAELPLHHPRPEPMRLPWLFGSALRMALSGALLLALGVASGLWSAATAQADDTSDDLSGLTLGTELDLEDLP